MLIIHSAHFSSSRHKLNCSDVTRHSVRVARLEETGRKVDRDIRRFVTRRCSGYSSGEECKFSLLLDVEESEVWGGGLVTISHSCVHTSNIRHDCTQHREQVRPNVGITSNCKNLFYQTIFSKVPKYCK